MNLFLLRHGVAVKRGDLDFANDELRPLTAGGRRQLRQTGAALRKLGPKFDLILSSPLVRARQTAEIAAADLRLKKRLSFADELKPGAPAKRLIQKINRLKPAVKNLLLVGHEPDLSELISLLVTGGPGLQLDFKKGGLAKLEVGKLRAGRCAALAWLLTPKQFAIMARDQP